MIVLEKGSQRLFQGLKVLRFTLPNGQNAPSLRLQQSLLFLVSPNVLFKFLIPEIQAGLWGLADPTSMSVPKTAVHEDNLSSRNEDEVGLSWQIFTM